MFQLVPVNITGPTYQSRSRPLSSQETQNFYQEVNEAGNNQYTLMPFPGLRLLDSVPGSDRGITSMAGVIYRVVGNTLYKYDSTHTEIGTISGSGRCIFANDGVNLFIANGTDIYWYNGVILQKVTDADIVGAFSVDIINNQFIYTKSDLTVVSTVGDGSTADGLDAIGAESKPDDLVRDFVFNEEILRFGTKTLERWYNTGLGRPPIERLQGQTQQVGLASRHSIAKSDNAYYFLSDDHQVYQGQTGLAQSITPPAIANKLESIGDVSDAVGYTCMFEGQWFYILQVGGLTFALNEKLGEFGWFTLSDGLQGGQYNVTSMYYLNGKNYCADGGDLLCLDINNFTHNGEIVSRKRVTQSIDGDIFQQRGKRLQMKRFELIAEMGTGLITGNENPKIRVESSIDGGKSWKHETWMTLGRLGNTSSRAEWFSNKTFYSLMVRLTITEPVPIYIYSGAIELRLAGR